MDVRIIPLGGLGEFGMNCCLVECGEDIVVIDAGLMFPDESAPGVDIIIPDFAYLLEHREQVRGILLTHAHEDHTGALPFLLRELDVPVYGTRLTLALIESKLSEHGIGPERRRVVVAPREKIELGCMGVEFLQVSHSIPDAMGLAIETPAGVILHTGDFKIDTTPVRSSFMDLWRFAQYGEKGVLALLSDSTNAERPGHTPSESHVAARIQEIFSSSQGRIFLTCFSTSLPRIQQVLDLAARFGRRVAVLGRSMKENIDIGARLDYLSVPPGLMVRREDAKDVPPGQLIVLASGSQGEPLSAMSRISLQDYPHARVEAGDTVVLSARIIPGNERAVSRVINRLVRRGARVLHEGVADVHVSGHASQEELKIILQLARPRCFIPVHGEFRQLYAHAELARQIGIPAERIIVAESGDCIRLGADEARIDGRVEVGRVFIDEGGFEEVEEAVLHDRKHLSEDGFLVIVLAINKADGTLQGAPEVISRGFLDAEGAGLLAEAQSLCIETVAGEPLEERRDWAAVKELLRRQVRKFLYKRTQKRPIIIPVILEV